MALVVDVARGAESPGSLPVELREALKGLEPEEKRARIRQYRESQRNLAQANRKSKQRKGLAAPSQGDRRKRIREYWEKHRGVSAQEWEKRQAELKGLSPGERKARIKKWRAERVGHRDDQKKLTPKERVGKREEIRRRLEREFSRLKVKQEQGDLTDKEKRRFHHLTELRKRFGLAPGSGGGTKREKQKRPAKPDKPGPAVPRR